jgi:membrane protease YdiL (CAAX protease family)
VLFEPGRPVPYVAVAWACAFFPSLLLSAVASQLLPGSTPKFPKVDPGVLLFLLVVFAPVVETLIMGVVLLILERIAGFLPALLISSVGWGIAHSLQAPAWGLVIWWPFLIFSLTFLTWRRRSLVLAFVLPMLVHALQNLGPALLLVSGASD